MIRVEDESYGINILIKIPKTNWYKSIWGDHENEWFLLDKKKNVITVKYDHDYPEEVLQVCPFQI